MTPEQIENLRAQFEAWALTQGMVIERYPPHHPTWPGQYMWTTPHREWVVWQACARLVAADITSERDAAREALRELVRLKALHDKIESRSFATSAESTFVRAEYARCKPIAWDRARAILEAKP